MNKRLIYYSIFAVLLGLIFRTAGSVHDALSWRNVIVGWWSWHIAGWIARDAWQGFLVIYVSIQALMNEGITGKRAVVYIAANVSASAVTSFFWHNFVYEWTLDNLKYFDW